MKNLNITLILLLLCFTTNSIAQDATNDATWEETIGFLTDFLPNFNHTSTQGAGIYHEKYNLHGLLLTKKSEGKDCNYTYVANLNELDKVVLGDDLVSNITSDLKLIFTGKIVALEPIETLLDIFVDLHNLLFPPAGLPCEKRSFINITPCPTKQLLPI